jgi:hypothetical protein
MADPSLRFPVVCPTCGGEELFDLPIATVAASLLKAAPIELHATCHDLRWNAGPVEVQQLREYLATVAGIEIQRVAPPAASGKVVSSALGAPRRAFNHEGKWRIE